MSVLDETWIADVATVYANDCAAIAGVQRPIAHTTDNWATTKLMAAAPDMARLLLSMEYICHDDDEFCPSCSASLTEGEPHGPDCEWLHVMQKAGLR